MPNVKFNHSVKNLLGAVGLTGFGPALDLAKNDFDRDFTAIVQRNIKEGNSIVEGFPPSVLIEYMVCAARKLKGIRLSDPYETEEVLSAVIMFKCIEGINEIVTRELGISIAKKFMKDTFNIDLDSEEDD